MKNETKNKFGLSRKTNIAIAGITGISAAQMALPAVIAITIITVFAVFLQYRIDFEVKK